jgi:hypothetical protein
VGSARAISAGFVALALTGCAASHHSGISAAGQAIARVEASSAGSGFAMSYPKTIASKTCLIVSGGPAANRIKGTCATAVRFRPGRRVRAVVTFTESWPWKSFHHAGAPHRTLHHSWRFGVVANGTLIGMGDRGDFPPQSVM